jgi:enoyl-[acyl-carrier protein] reductase III
MNTEAKTALVTGGTRGIGKAISLRLAEGELKTIFVNYLQNDIEAQKTSDLIKKNGRRCIPIKANLLYPNEIDIMFEQIQKHSDHINVFIHCAALNAFKPLKDTKPNQWDLTINVNSRGFLYCVQKCIPLMKRGGKIVAVSSLGSQRVIPNYGAMGPTKAALETTVKYLAAELAVENIQVNGVSGGFIDTDSLKNFPEYEQLIQKVIGKTPANRIGTPQDIAEAVYFLISPAAEFIYGQTVIVDGGLSLF